MTIRRVNPPDLYDPAAYGMSQATLDPRSGLVFVSGQVAWDVNGRVKGQGYGEQTSIALENLSTVLAAAGTRRVPVELHFEKLDHFNSSTITSIIQLIQDSRARGIKLIIVYDQALKWQKLSFDALRVFAKDDLLELRSR